MWIIWRILGLMLAAVLAFGLLYISRFWTFELWSRDGLFGAGIISPRGDLVAQWLRGTELSPFELILWAVGSFLLLSLVENIVSRLRR